jgi:hypothetical protein
MQRTIAVFRTPWLKTESKGLSLVGNDNIQQIGVLLINTFDFIKPHPTTYGETETFKT